MTITEVFPNPTVKRVIFQIRFPNLFYLESKIGELQLKVIQHFPESALLFRRQLLFTDIGPEAKLDEIPVKQEETGVTKIWQFKSPERYVLNVLPNSLDISSQYHKTYNLGRGDKFRDIIKFVVEAFLSVAPVPIFTRIGLRYIDECPIPSKDTDTLRSYYNSAFPLDRFDIADALEMDFKTVVKRADMSIRYVESLQKSGDAYRLIMDFDGFRENIEPSHYLSVTDDIHTLISDEFERSIKQPVYDYMRGSAGG
jgi:uncharacterized protein (TIGR04255 family)